VAAVLFYDLSSRGMLSGFQCAGCGEWNETRVDSSAGTRQTYVEDCQVCCKPNVLQIQWDASSGEFTITADLE
jgi:cysteine-rich CPXCG protein